MKKTSLPGPLILISTSLDFQATSGEPSPLVDLFDISLMERVLKIRISKTIDLTAIEEAFAEKRNPPEAALVSIGKIVFEPLEDPLEKVFLLRNLFNDSDTVRDPAAKNKIIRNLGYLLFAKQRWFNENIEFAQHLFQRKEFDELFFTKRTDYIHLFIKKNAPVINPR